MTTPVEATAIEALDVAVSRIDQLEAEIDAARAAFDAAYDALATLQVEKNDLKESLYGKARAATGK